MKKKKLIKYIFLILLALIVFVIGFYILNIIIKNNQTNKLIKKIDKVKETEIKYVMVEINPRFILRIKNGLVKDVLCLNYDCKKIRNKLDVSGKNIEDAVLNLYDEAEKEGYDTSKGVQISSNEYLEKTFDSYDFITVNIISKKEVEEKIEEVKEFDDEFKEIEDETDKKIYETLKRDSDYGKYYTCTYENEYLDCRFNKDLDIWFSGDFDITKWGKVLPNMQAVARVFEKFGVTVESKKELDFLIPLNKVIINGTGYYFYSDKEDSTKLSEYYLAYQKDTNCSYESEIVYLKNINLADLGSIKTTHKISKMNGYNQFGKASYYLCGPKLCLKREFTDKKMKYNYDECAYDTITDIKYFACDTNKKNCKEIKESEYFTDYHPTDGYIMDLEECIINGPSYYPPSGICRAKGYDDAGNFVDWSKQYDAGYQYDAGFKNETVIEYTIDAKDIPYEY